MKQKTLQEQYNLIKKGKGNSEIFQKAAKTQFPNMVRNAASLNETIASLKHGHIISENIWGIANQKTSKPDWFKIFDENMNLISEEEAKAIEKKTSKEVTDLQAPDRGYDYKDDKMLNNVAGEQFRQGYYTELTDEANSDKTKQELIDLVIKNMSKNPQYYVEEAQFGIKGIGYSEDAPGLGKGKMVKDAGKGGGYGEATKKDFPEGDIGTGYLEIKENKNNINEVGVLAIAGGTALGILGAVVGYKAFEFLKRGISNAASSVAVKVDDMLQDKLTKHRMEKHKSLIIGALNRLKSDPEFENYVELLLSNPNSGTPDMKTTSGKIRVKRKGDYNDMRKLRSSTIKDFKTYLTKNLTPEEQGVFNSIYDAASQGEGKSIPENKNKNNVKNVGEGRTSLLSILKEDYALGEKAPVKTKTKKVKKETTDSKLSEIEKNGRIATLEIQIEALEEIISSKNERISMVTEDDSLSELVDKKKMKEMQREIKLLEKRKSGMEKIYEKMCGMSYSKKIAEGGNIDSDANPKSFLRKSPDSSMEEGNK